LWIILLLPLVEGFFMISSLLFKAVLCNTRFSKAKRGIIIFF
jgi:hypothetical protein